MCDDHWVTVWRWVGSWRTAATGLGVVACLSAGCASGTHAAGSSSAASQQEVPTSAFSGVTPTTAPWDPSVFYGDPTGQIIYGCPVTGSSMCAATADGRNAHGIGYGDSVSPDGQLVASSGDLYGRSADGAVTVAPISDSTAYKTIWRFTGSGTVAPSWSPDSQKLAVVVGAPDVYTPKRPTPVGLWTMGRNGSGARLVAASATGPTAWNPSGTRVAFLVGGNSAGTPMSVQSVPAGGGPAITLAMVPEAPWDTVTLSWSPDGQTILLAEEGVGPISKLGHSRLLSIPANGGSPTQIIAANSSDGIEGAFYSPNGAQVVLSVVCKWGTRTDNEAAGLVIANTAFTHFHALGSSADSNTFCPLPLTSTLPMQLRAEALIGWVSDPSR
jgi:Tol biopolymer transport system component